MATKEFFPGIEKIKFEGKDSKNPMAFRYYDAEKVINGKKMKDWLRFAMAWWHTLCAEGGDQFGGGTKQFPWNGNADAIQAAKDKMDAGLDFIIIFNPAQPDLQITTQFIHVVTARFYVQNRRKISRFQFYRTDKEISLTQSIRFRIIKMVGSANESILTCLIKIMHKSRIAEVSSFGSLHKNKTDRERSMLHFTECCPVYMPLMMRNIKAMNSITIRNTYSISLQAVTRFPAISIRTDEKPIETQDDANRNHPCQQTMKPHRHLERRLESLLLFCLSSSFSGCLFSATRFVYHLYGLRIETATAGRI